jgi:hypothetical protein
MSKLGLLNVAGAKPQTLTAAKKKTGGATKPKARRRQPRA